VLAGRATDTAVSAAFALMREMPPGPAWHAAKIIECGGQCTTNPASGGVFARIDHRGFTVEPLDPDTACTPASVAAHMLYETVNPYTMREPGGTIEVASARYAAIDERIVRAEFFDKTLTERVADTLDLPADSERQPATPAEVGVMLVVSAPDQQTATAISKLANPLLLHLPLPTMSYLPSFAFATSPAHVDRGAAYEFVLNHVVDVDSPTEMFRLEMEPRHA
jgi:Acyclic terpene utilisation family protein AtuA